MLPLARFALKRAATSHWDLPVLRAAHIGGLNNARAVFHRPHPRKETDRGAVVAMRRFLIEAGVEP